MLPKTGGVTPGTHPALQRSVWLVLGAWLSALTLVGAVVAPAAFAVAPTPAVAGDLVGRVLAAVDYAGAASGVLLAGLAFSLGRPGSCIALPLLATALCLVSRFEVTPRIAALRPLAMGPGADAVARERFGQLHGLSVGLFAAVGIALIALSIAHARAERGSKKNFRFS